MRWLLVLLAATRLVAADVALRSPLTTIHQIPAGPGDRSVVITLRVPEGAPPDLGMGVVATDRDGRWWQRPLVSGLRPGTSTRTADLGGAAPLAAEPPPAGWDETRRIARIGVYLWSSRPSSAVIGVDLRLGPGSAAAGRAILADLICAPARIATGDRWEVSVRPWPMPADPHDPESFSLRLHVVAPDGTTGEHAGFLREPMDPSDRGDREDMIPSGPAAFCVRFRPVMPGVHRLRLVARWAGGAAAACDLPDLVATGGAWDGYVRIDRDDPRFFSVAGRFWWPVGLNLHNPFDARSQEVLGTRLTPPRGTLAYGAILDRLSAAGGDATEIWLSSWNLALSWRADWSGFSGPSGINLANAERLDRILDHAWSRGIRVNLVLNNHGQASPKTDREWKDNPLNTANGGPLTEPAQVFEHPAALAHQERVRRYLAARYADHPAILGWKLWSEIDLTAGRGEALRGWHEQAAERWKALDAYRHPVATHWSGDYRRVDGAIAALPQLDYLCLDAYRHAREDDDPTPLADILAGSLWDPKRGLARLRKPVLVTEYGGGAGPTPLEFRTVDHAIGGWIGLVCGHAGAPMLWWWEWVDQDGRWAPYRALRRFIAGEDLRGAGGRSYVLDAGPLWSRGWVRPGVVLGYLLDRRWGVRGGEAPRIGPARVRIADAVEAGRLEARWWDADTGEQVGGRTISHPGGALDLESPAFAGHIAFKLRRIAP